MALFFILFGAFCLLISLFVNDILVAITSALLIITVIVILALENQNKSPKTISLPEEICVAKSGDTLVLIETDTSISLEFWHNYPSQRDKELIIIE